MLKFLKATWDHLPPLPKKPSLPPSLLALKSRKAWLAMRPKFTYGDERDKIQRDQERRARRQLARDEAWVKYEKKKQERLEQKQAQKELRMQKRVASSAKMAAKAKSVAAKRPPTTGKTTSSSSRARVAVTTQPARMETQRRVFYTHVPAQAGSGMPKPAVVKQPVIGTRPAPQTRKTMPLPTPTRRPTQAWGPIAAATQKSPVASPRVVRSQTMPVTIPRR